MSRRSKLEKMASLVGNAAAHDALFGGGREAPLYTDQAADIASGRAWNDREVAHFRRKANARAKSEIRKRMRKYGRDPRKFEIYAERAAGYVDEFAEVYLGRSKTEQ